MTRQQLFLPFLLCTVLSSHSLPGQTAIAPIRVPGGFLAQNRLTMVQPTCGPAIAAHTPCSCHVRVVIGKDGHVLDAKHISGNPIQYADCEQAISRWTYKPWLVNGFPVKVEAIVSVNIQLNGDAYLSPQINH